uniref:Uncharacterized protein n=1 Tax=Amphimedon queenslandica TaxID=400682 RepID=A0A1X7V256_AMPQE
MPSHRQAQRICAKKLIGNIYIAGLNDWAFDIASKNEVLLQNSMDGTRIVRIIELCNKEYLVGAAFSPDVGLFPSQNQIPNISNAKQHIASVRQHCGLATEAYTFDLVDLKGEKPDMLLGSIPEATKGVTGTHIFALIMAVEEKACEKRLALIGHCTDSATNSLAALKMLAIPDNNIQKVGVKYIGLPMHGICYSAPKLHQGYPSITYPCWHHSSHTAVRNLLNGNISITVEPLAHESRTTSAKIASVLDFKQLKANYP